MPGMRPYISGPNNFSATGLVALDSTTALSLAFWMRKPAGDCDFLRHGAAYNREGFYTGLAGGGSWAGTFMVRFCDDTSESNFDSAPGLFELNRWQHIALTWDSVRLCFWRNGALLQSRAASKTMTTGGTRNTVLAWGSLWASMNVSLFDLRVFPQVTLTAGEVKACMDPRRVVAGCRGQWFRHWKARASTTVYDESGTGSNLISSATLTAGDTCEEPPWREAVGAR